VRVCSNDHLENGRIWLWALAFAFEPAGNPDCSQSSAFAGSATCARVVVVQHAAQPLAPLDLTRCCRRGQAPANQLVRQALVIAL
jgi:hypothetical protein